eukprot:1679327-Rhodomonas_salina.1
MRSCNVEPGVRGAQHRRMRGPAPGSARRGVSSTAEPPSALPSALPPRGVCWFRGCFCAIRTAFRGPVQVDLYRRVFDFGVDLHERVAGCAICTA